MTDEQQMIREIGENGIGVFNFSYNMKILVNKYEGCFTEIPTLDSCTCDGESMIESTSPWSWIAVTILFMLLTTVLFLVSIFLVCIIRQKSEALKVKENQHRTDSHTNRK